MESRLQIAARRAKGEFDVKISPRHRRSRSSDDGRIDVKPTGTVAIDGRFHAADGTIIISHADEERAIASGEVQFS